MKGIHYKINTKLKNFKNKYYSLAMEESVLREYAQWLQNKYDQD